MFVIKLLTNKIKENRLQVEISRDKMFLYLELLVDGTIGFKASMDINKEHENLRRLVALQHRLEQQLKNYRFTNQYL